jgi:hypothetical protein
LGSSYASIDTMDDGAVAHYEGMLLSIQHRFEHNFTFLANYTYSYCLFDYDFGAALATRRIHSRLTVMLIGARAFPIHGRSSTHR